MSTPAAATSAFAKIAPYGRHLRVLAKRFSKLLRNFTKRGGGQAHHSCYVAPQLRTTGGYPQCPVQACGLPCPLRIPAAPFCEKALKNISLDYDTCYYRKKAFEKKINDIDYTTYMLYSNLK